MLPPEGELPDYGAGLTMVSRIPDSLAAQAALSANLDPNHVGTDPVYVVFDNHRYYLAYRDGKWVGWDISVYDDQGRLVTSSTDVWLNALRDAPDLMGNIFGDLVSLIGFALITYMALKFSRK